MPKPISSLPYPLTDLRCRLQKFVQHPILLLIITIIPLFAQTSFSSLFVVASEFNFPFLPPGVLSWSGEAVVLQPAAVLSEDGDEEEDHDEEERAEEEEGDDYEEDGDEEEDEVEGRECPCHSSLLFEHFVKVFCITLLG